MATIQGIYLALFGRPADPAGLAFFEDATDGGTNLGAIGDLTASEEYQTRFESGTSEDFIRAVYASLFGREPEADGLAYYQNEFDAGRLTAETVAINILDGVQGDDIAALDARLAAADLFTAHVDLDREIYAYNAAFEFQGVYAGDVGRDYIDAVTTSDPTTEAEADAAILRLFPSVEVTLGEEALVEGDETVVTFTFSEQVEGFTLDDVTSSLGELSDLQANEDNTIFTAMLTAGAEDGDGEVAVTEFSYTDRDGIVGLPGEASYTVGEPTTPPPGGGNTAPDAGSFEFSFEGSPYLFDDDDLLADASDADGDTLTIVGIDTESEFGFIADDGNGNYVYTAKNGANSPVDSFEYQVTDGTVTVSGIVTVDILPT